MKGTILSGVLAASLLLTGCASMLTREYGSVEPHSATLVSEGDANTLRAESYQDVVNGLIYFINRGAESGSIRFDGEEPDVRALLDEACLEVVQEDPLGAYAVEYIKYNVAPIVGSYEADVHIPYRRSREQVAAITDATGASAIRSELSEALAAFSPEVVLRISYFEEDEAYLRQLVREAYLSDPASALGMPEAEIAMYPESGPRRIVEILLTYPKSRETLESQRNSLRREAERLAAEGIDEDYYQRVRRASFGSNLRGLNSFENIAVTLTEGYFHGYDPFRFPQVFDSITKEDVAAFLRRNLTAERAVLSEIVPREN